MILQKNRKESNFVLRFKWLNQNQTWDIHSFVEKFEMKTLLEDIFKDYSYKKHSFSSITELREGIECFWPNN